MISQFERTPQEQHRIDLLGKFGYENKQTFGSGGFVFLDDVMGGDSDIARVARTSYGEGTKTVNDDTALIRRLIKDNHTSPVEALRIRLFIRAPLELVQQFKTHRTFSYASFNQYSQRYSVAIDECATVAPTEWRAQSTSNKQGSSGSISDVWPGDLEPIPATSELTPITPGYFLSYRQKELQDLAREVYQERLDFGVAREQARSDLPLSNYTELYCGVDLHNLLHFLQLRLDPHAQQEIRELAGCIANIVEQWVPTTYKAFCDYRMNAITFSAQELSALNDLLGLQELDEFLNWAMDIRAAELIKHGLISLNERIAFVNKIRTITGITKSAPAYGAFA